MNTDEKKMKTSRSDDSSPNGAVNSPAWWERRFAGDCESKNGSARTRFYGELAVENMPGWLIDDITEHRLSICDWGCALGEAADLLKERFPGSDVTGVDFAENAIEQASRSYPSIAFSAEDISVSDRSYDVVFSSNTLEHFGDPFAVLARLAAKARKYLVVLVPFRDQSDDPEHLFRFDFDNFATRVAEEFSLLFFRTVDAGARPGSRWNGEQALAVYGRGGAPASAAGAEYPQGAEPRLEDFRISDCREGRFLIARLALASQAGERALAEVRRRLTELGQDKERILAELSEARQQIVKLKREKEAAEVRLAQRNRHIASQNKRIGLLDARSAELESSLRFEARQSEMRRIALQNVYDSLSWRLTGGLRRLVRPFVERPLLKRGTAGMGAQASPASAWKAAVPSAHRPDLVAAVMADARDKLGIIIVQGVVEWSVPLFQRPQHLATALSRNGYTVVYMTSSEFYDEVEFFQKLGDSLFIASYQHYGYEDLARLSNAALILFSTATSNTPELVKFMRDSGVQVIYDYIDHIDEKISGSRVKQLVSMFHYVEADTVDYVFASARNLFEEMEHKVSPEQLLLVRNGVDLEHYQKARQEFHGVVPREMRGILADGKPVAGYFGAIAPWLDYDLISEVADILADKVNLVFIGPDYYDGVSKLPARDNIYYLGIVEYAQLTAYAQHFSIGFIPFERGQIAQTTSPLKLYEYFALGKPVVVTSDMLECINYRGVYPAADAPSFANAVIQGLAAAHDTEIATALETQARENTWLERAAVICERIGRIAD